jgi:hypothetical protein
MLNPFPALYTKLREGKCLIYIGREGWLTFITKLTETLAWPVIVLIVATLFRQPIVEVIPALRRLRYKEFEVEFGRDLLETQQRTAVTVPERAQLPPSGMETLARLQRVAAVAPSAAVLEAWREIETAAADAASNYGLTATGGSWELLLGLRNQKVLDSTQVETMEALRKLRNKVAHARDGEVTEDQALRYAEIAVAAAEGIRSSVRPVS